MDTYDAVQISGAAWIRGVKSDEGEADAALADR
jgi:hypothetical protein